MSTFRVSVNGRPWFDSDDLTTVTMAVEDLRHSRRPRVSVHASSRDGALQWLDADLKAGDTISIEVLEEAASDAAPACRFCGRDPFDAPRLIESRATQICSLCIADFAAALGQGSPLPEGAAFHDEAEWACGFCGRRPKDIPGVIVRNGAALCPECVRACADIVSQT